MSTDVEPTGQPFSPPLRCDVGGDYFYLDMDKPAVYREPCTATPTHRYRGPGFTEGHWGHRCHRHVGWLDRSFVTVEALPLASNVAALTDDGAS